MILSSLGVNSIRLSEDVFQGEIGPKLKLAEQILEAFRTVGVVCDVQAHQLVLGTDVPALTTIVETSLRVAMEKAKEQHSAVAAKVQKEAKAKTSSSTPPSTAPAPKAPESNKAPKQVLIATRPKARVFENPSEKLESSIQQRRDLLKENAALKSKLAELQTSSLPDLVALVREHEYIKLRERDFKATCRTERERLELMASDNELAASQSQTQSVIAIAKRQTNEPPLVCEVYQYQRRFTELYEEMSNIADEHRSSIDTFNMLDSRLKLLVTETQTLQSLKESFEKSRGVTRARFVFCY